MNDDSSLIDALGGPAKVAALLGYDKAKGGIQRVHNWYARGIPPKVKLEHPEIFLNAREKGVASPTPEVSHAA